MQKSFTDVIKSDFDRVKEVFIEFQDGPKIKLFSNIDLEKLTKTISSVASDDEVRNKKISMVKSIFDSGEYRLLKDIPVNFRGKLAQLLRQFPNFSEVIEYIGTACEIAIRSDFVVKLSAPILLSGPPGVGKTYFCEEIAKFFDAGYETIRYDSAQSGSEMSGSSSFWNNAEPGKPFIHLTHGTTATGALAYANPVFFLDEIDKTSAGNYDPLGPLYGLLDSSAKRFTDLCFNLPIDASHIRYFCACNDLEKIPNALLSRFRVFEIEITAEQSRTIARSIVSKVMLELMPATTDLEIDDEIFNVFENQSPRKIKQQIVEAIGRALARNNSVVRAHDFTVVNKKRKMGFM